MAQNTQKKLVVLRTAEGERVAVNVNNITYIRPRIDGAGILIAFPGDDGIGVEGTFDEVLVTLDNA